MPPGGDQILTFHKSLWVSVVSAAVAMVCAILAYPRSWPLFALVIACLLALNWVTAIYLVGTDVGHEGVLVRRLIRRRWIPAEDIVHIRTRGRLFQTVEIKLSGGEIAYLPCVERDDVQRIRDVLAVRFSND
jgi:hypothetical protein